MSSTDAEDITQETFLRAGKTKKFPSQEGEKRWLYTIARNIVIDRQRWWRRFGAKHDNGDLFAIGAPAVTEPAVLVLKHLAKLPLRQREVFVLRHWHGFSTTDCAKLLNIGEGSVKSHLSRAVAGLKKALGENRILNDNQTTVQNVSNGEDL